MYKTTGAGFKIGNISINSTACADDIVLFSQGPRQAQIIIDLWLMTTHIWKASNYNQHKVYS